MKMEEMRRTALAYYANLPESKQQEAREFFRSLDKDGDGKIDVEEFTAVVNQGITVISFFKDLDKDGNGSLDFDEFITLFYVYESGRYVCCDGCNGFIKEVYFTCVECFDDPTSDSFDLCCFCYQYKNFKNHDHTVFCDNHALLIRKKRQQGSQSPTQSSQSPPSPTQASQSRSSPPPTQSSRNQPPPTQAFQSRPSRRQAFRSRASRRQQGSQNPKSQKETLETMEKVSIFAEAAGSVFTLFTSIFSSSE